MSARTPAYLREWRVTYVALYEDPLGVWFDEVRAPDWSRSAKPKRAEGWSPVKAPRPLPQAGGPRDLQLAWTHACGATFAPKNGPTMSALPPTSCPGCGAHDHVKPPEPPPARDAEPGERRSQPAKLARLDALDVEALVGLAAVFGLLLYALWLAR